MAGTNPDTSISQEMKNISYMKDKVTFNSHIQAPNPCHVIEQETEKLSEDNYRIDIRTVEDQLNNQSVCTTQTLMIKYEGSFQAEIPFTLEIRHNNQTADTIEASDITRQDPKDNREKGGFSGFMNWFGNLF